MQIPTLIRDYLKFILISFIIVYLYNVASHFITQMPIVAGKRVFLVEFPIYLVFVSLFYFPKSKSSIFKYILPNIPGLFLYLCFDLLYHFLLRAARASDFANIATIYNFYPVAFVAGVLLIALLLLLIYKIFSYAKKFYTNRNFFKSLLLRTFAAIALPLFLYSKAFATIEHYAFKPMEWSDSSTIKKNGRIFSFLHFSLLEAKNRAKLLQQANNSIDIQATLYSGHPKIKPNIYIVVLESFINPNYIQNIHYNKNPLSPKLLPYLKNGDFSHVISPVYGGNTAQAEFEILTGIHAFAKVDTIEFNILKGYKINAFLSALKSSGYQTKATIATSSQFFNSKLAYKSLGFDSVTFLKESPNFTPNPNDKKIFDGDLFNYNFKEIEENLKTSKQPLFNYILGMYGHVPYERNLKSRPNVITIKGKNYPAIKRVANQFYYRTQALAEYIKNIYTIDPTAIILISSDHIPAILNNKIKYKFDKHTNIALLLHNKEFQTFNTIPQYQLPHLIWKILTNNKELPNIDKQTMQKLYFKALYEGIGSPK